MGTEATVQTLPMCDFCTDGTQAKYDGRTQMGPWAYMCQFHWERYGPGQLGTGFGQRLLSVEEATK